MALRILQYTTVVMFAAMVVSGIVIVATNPVLLPAFKELIGVIWPIFMMEVVPALIGRPLTDAVRNLTGKKDAQSG